MVNPFSGQCLLTSRVRYGRPQRCRGRVIIQEEKDGGHGSKGDSSLARATHVDNPIREEEINTGAPALLS